MLISITRNQGMFVFTEERKRAEKRGALAFLSLGRGGEELRRYLSGLQDGTDADMDNSLPLSSSFSSARFWLWGGEELDNQGKVQTLIFFPLPLFPSPSSFPLPSSCKTVANKLLSLEEVISSLLPFIFSSSLLLLSSFSFKKPNMPLVQVGKLLGEMIWVLLSNVIEFDSYHMHWEYPYTTFLVNWLVCLVERNDNSSGSDWAKGQPWPYPQKNIDLNGLGLGLHETGSRASRTSHGASSMVREKKKE